MIRALVLCCFSLTSANAVLADEPQAPRKGPQPTVAADHPEKAAKGLEIFKKHVRPVLVKRCLACHGGDQVESEFNLATREGLLKGGLSGGAVVPGDAAKSRIVKLIRQTEEPHMPYEEKRLANEEIDQVVAWIEHGAPYDKPLVEGKVELTPWTERVVADEARDFWSFQPLKNSAPPSVQDETWCRTPIDRFVLARLEAEGLIPNSETDRRRLIRRAYFDLLGVPPGPEAVEAFVHDAAPNAYERLLDRILASPRYGERWARHWLDLARFAESHGFEHDYDRSTAYPYRDFVIKAFNDDLPYDTFVKWQLAGDEFAPDNYLAMMATGFLAAGVHSTQITANEVEKHRYDELDDMIATTGTAMLGLTIGCARCHDHKFDPIPQRDYYRLLSAFTTTIRSEVDLNLDPQGYAIAKAAFDREHAPLVEALRKFEVEQLPGRFEKWEATRTTDDLPKWVLLNLVEFKSAGGATLTKLDDGSLLASGTNPQFDTYTFTAHSDLKGITAVRLEALAHESFVKGGPGRASNGNIALTDFRVTAAPREGSAPAVALKLGNPQATFEQQGLPVKAAVDDDPKSAWAVDPQFGKDHAAVFEVETPPDFDGKSEITLTFTLKFENNTGHNIGRPRMSVTTASKPVSLDGGATPQNIVTILATPRAERTEKQSAEVLQWYRRLDHEWQKLNKIVEDHAQQAPQPTLLKALVSSEGLPPVRLHSQGADFFNETFFLNRGDTAQKLGVAPTGFLQVLMTAPERDRHWSIEPPKESRLSYRRSALANWITDVDHGAGHLLARVVVNRLWQHHMGRGIVATPSDFGERGERPTHPELLDWLAGELIRHNWQLKPIHKLMMQSAVYRQTSQFDEAKASIDNENTLFWRQPHRRLEAEVIRDALLVVGQSLEDRMYGPGTLDETHRRRSIYFTVKRSKLVPMMQVFDAPDALSGVGERSQTTIAPQALLLMNNPQIRSYAANFAKRLIPAAEESPANAVHQGYLIALSRPPSDAELADNTAFLESQTASYQAAGKPDPRELALADFCQVLMCLNEFVYVE